MHAHRLAAFAAAIALAGAPAAHAAQPFTNIPYATWTDDEPQYRLYPGDELDVTVPSAPELNKTVTVQPDGRIIVPLIGPQMAADRTATELADALTEAYAADLLRPETEVTVRAQPLKIFVGGEVGKPGVYDMPGDIDALRAIVEAGGFTNSAKRSQVIVIRRAAGGRAMLRTVDLGRALKNPRGVDLVPLRRFDVIYVPTTGLANFSNVMTEIRNSLPLSFSYAAGTSAAVF
ncbi:MAG TPA: polysaccharide biosynthesis/export family protein [Caulobacteraceae bacterium]|jgi:polysaccharide export outer membrane protein